MNKEKQWENGVKKYDNFVIKIIGDSSIFRIRTPHTSLLSKLSELKETDDEFIKLAILELAENFNQ